MSGTAATQKAERMRGGGRKEGEDKKKQVRLFKDAEMQRRKNDADLIKPG